MDKMIIIPINLFKLDQEILILNEDGSTTNFAFVDLAMLPEVAVEACSAYDINKVRLIGNGNYATALSNEIKEYALQNYSNKELDISIMEA